MRALNESLLVPLPGAGELITGPTVPGDVMAAGNLICASPPYLTNSSREISLLTEVEHVSIRKGQCSVLLCYLHSN